MTIFPHKHLRDYEAGLAKAGLKRIGLAEKRFQMNLYTLFNVPPEYGVVRDPAIRLANQTISKLHLNTRVKNRILNNIKTGGG